jgi:predicted transposase YbfD/YdcC
MKKIPQHTVYLQDGSLCNFRKRIWKQAKPLISCFEKITDPRKKRGIRHSHVLILFILFASITRGSTTLKDCHLWAIHNKKFLKRYFSLFHGIPDSTTISRLLSEINPEGLIKAYRLFLAILGISLGEIGSFDGKTMRGVTGKDSIRHILSLFSHLTHSVLSQIGVTNKENEIPAFRRLLTQISEQTDIKDFLFLADALHAQKDTAAAIIAKQADYLLVIKGNQKDFFNDIVLSFTPAKDLPGNNSKQLQIKKDRYTLEENSRKRQITTNITTTSDSNLCNYLQAEHGFTDIKTVGVLERSGKRISKDGTITLIKETVCFVSSRKLEAKQAALLLKNHWCIENNLHWVKDFVFLEDRQTLRSGNAPQIMSFLRSMVISLCNLIKFESLSTAIHNFDKDKPLHYQFLKMAAIV